ncbi:aryl-sulfate sulfotransferase [Flavobacterium phycosphaerae]|uniref:aryl-sulfate sulfotransferase n=1 Tax=Flavobacterium phycosphaerae TaxID=2697515 RepID=UPI0013894B64|nr:aryl-sulfate sulfotransferase [Flavobacterium phycosphaerae]
MELAKKITVFTLSICWVLFLFSCSNNEYVDPDNKLTAIKIATGEIYPAFNPEIKDYYITSINTLNPIEITLDDFDPTKNIYINNVKVLSKITTVKLQPGENIIIKSGYHTDTTVTYTIHYLPADMPKINVITKNNPSEGYILINLFDLSPVITYDYSYIAILNNDGYPVYYKRLPYPGVINFKYFDIGNNQKRFSYNVNDIGKIVVMNEKFEEIKQLDLLPNNNHGNYPTDNHDCLYLDDNHYILPAYITRENVDMTAFGGSNSVNLGEFVFQEIQNNQVLFEWNTADHTELLSATDPIYYAQYATSPKVDYFHFNSINIDPNDNNFIISARHTNQVYKVNRNTGAIMWRFGGSSDDFNLTENEIISHPHHATMLPNGHLLLFDNGVTKNPKQTRIAEFALDEVNLTADLVYEYKDIGRYSDIMGSVQKMPNGNYFIGWGGNITSQINASKSDITEVDANGNIVLDISFSNNPNSFTYSYRALKYNINFNE